jgi:hypothetical protein
MRLLNLSSGARLGTGLAIGAGAVLLAPVLVPVAAGVLKSLTKAGIKGGLILYEKGLVLAEETKETLGDLAAEAKSEISEERELALAAPKKAAKGGAKS